MNKKNSTDINKKLYRPKDINQLAKYIVDLSTGEETEKTVEEHKAIVKAAKKKPAKKKE